MVNEDAITDGESRDGLAELYNPAGRFVSQDGGRLASNVPRESIAGTDAADGHFNESVSGLKIWDGFFFDSDVVQIVEPSDTHLRRYGFCESQAGGVSWLQPTWAQPRPVRRQT